MTESRLLAIETLTGGANKTSKELLYLMQRLANCKVNTKTYYRLIDEIDYKQAELTDKLDKLLTELERGSNREQIEKSKDEAVNTLQIDEIFYIIDEHQ